MGLFDNAQTVYIDNTEVTSIVKTSDNGVIWEKPNPRPYIAFTIDATTNQNASASEHLGSFTGTNIEIDWGDGTALEEYQSGGYGYFSHTYASSGIYNGRVYGVTGFLYDDAFSRMDNLTSVTLPNEITSISVGTFSECTALTSVTLPSNLTSLGDYCFGGSTSLTSITLPSSLTSIGTGCFNGTGITSITIPSGVTSLACFSRCSALTSITIPSSVTTLGDYCFMDCSGLETITILGNITSCGESCFEDCSSLESITLPNTITTLGVNCFKGSGLTSINIPSSVTSLANDCFMDCSGLETVTLPNTMTSLGLSCFEGCSSLESITIPSSVTSIGNDCFSNTSSLSSIEFEWDNSTDILSYKNNWGINIYNNNLKIIIPQGTTSLYEAKGYPIDNLVENTSSITLSSNKSILSYADSETATLQATLTNSGVAVPNEIVVFESNNPTVIIENLNTGSTPYQTPTSLTDNWKLTATKNDYTQIDIYYGSSSTYVRIGFSDTKIKLSYPRGVADILLNGSVLYHSNGVFITDTGDMYDATNSGQTTVSYNNMQFVVYANISSIEALIGSDVTDNNGVAECSYSSQGVGDVSFRAIYGNIVSETFTIEDTVLYAEGSSNAHFQNAIINNGWFTSGSSNKPIISIDNPINLPSSFEISYTGLSTGQSGGWNLLMVGASADCNQYNLGMLNNNGGFIRKGRDGCTLTTLISPSNIYTYGNEVSIVYQYNNGVHKLIIDNNEYATTNSDYAMSKFFGIGVGTGSKMKELKIKPL